jgi:GNAT superfamily N-acetyltransferase
MTEKLLEFHPVTPDRWEDFVSVFGQNGACSGCWCMYWRSPRKEWLTQTNDFNRSGIKSLVDTGREPGLLAYVDSVPAAWVSVGPRSDFPMLNTSRVLAPVDDQPVWSIVCFFIHRKYRRTGLMQPLIAAAVDYARSKGARIVEGYPTEPGKKVEAGSMYLGAVSAFKEAGFTEVARRSATHPIFRMNVFSINW